MDRRKTLYVIGIAAFASIVTYLHYSTIESVRALHDIYRELYYIPLLVGALAFGLRGAIITYLFIAILYLPYMTETWTGAILFETKRMLFLLFSGIFASVAGYLVDRDSRRKKELEKERFLAGLGQVSSAIAHDLKNPIITVEGFARRLQKGKGDPSAAIEAIIDSAEVMKNIVTDVLDFAKPIKLQVKEDDAVHIVKKTCELCSGKAEQRGVALSVDVPDIPMTVDFDGPRMQRALLNLISNAIEASGRGQEVTVSTRLREDSLLITISDHGAGIDRETRESLFVPFFTKKSTGTGLGMPTAKKIIEGHDGEIHVESQPGKGTQIIIGLPVKRK